MLPHVASPGPAPACPQGSGSAVGMAAGRGSCGVPRTLAGSLCGVTGCGVQALLLWDCRWAKPEVYQLLEGWFVTHGKSQLQQFLVGWAAGWFVGGIKSLAPKLLKQGWRALCLQGPGWVLARVWLMHANSKSPCNKPNKAGDSNVKANEITPRLGVCGDKSCGRSADLGFHWGLIQHSRFESRFNCFVNSFGTILLQLCINSTPRPQPFTGSSGY